MTEMNLNWNLSLKFQCPIFVLALPGKCKMFDSSMDPSCSFLPRHAGKSHALFSTSCSSPKQLLFVFVYSVLKHPWFLAGLYIFLFIPIHGNKQITVAALNFSSSWFPQSFNLCQISHGWLGISYPYDYIYIYKSNIYIYVCIRYISWYPTFYPEASWNLIKPYWIIFRPSAKFQVAKKETMMAVRGRVQLHSGHLFGGQDGNMLMMLWVGWYGSCSLVCELWQHSDENMRHQESPRMKNIVANSETVCDSPGEVHN